ncbi:MAG: AAA family ATPase [Muribaculaceae bacterium]|nr:AAA family ATPase [Muribaculaceae bacterium]
MQNEALRKFGEEFLSHLPYTPNNQQYDLIAGMAKFCMFSPSNAVMLVRGYAGTGKTSLTGALVKTLIGRHVKCVLMAPTGRAAKVFTEHAGHAAFTIHRRIYRQQRYGYDGDFGVAENKDAHTVFIVDEASMISNDTPDGGAFFGTGHLLDDLIHYVYSGVGCRLILIGDTAQLPPVGQTESPALSKSRIEGYGLEVWEMQLTEIARQAAESAILRNATALRQFMQQSPLPVPVLSLERGDDIENLSGEFLIETLSDCYARDGMSETIVITRSNKRATMFNLGIRNQILYREDELVSDDMLLVSKNNYFWSEEYKELDFIANGDVMRVTRTWGEIEHRYGLRFANVTVEFPDHDFVEMDAKIILDALISDAPALSRAQNERLFNEVMEELPGTKAERFRALKKHPYFNALQVKYAYTVTCHKAQGGQWKNVFVDMGYIPQEAFSTIDFYRWLYTAITRAKSHVYLINCPLVNE